MNDERATFRYSLGIVAVLGGLAGLGGLYLVEVPPGNRDAVVLALGLVLGWGSIVIGYEFGSSAAGRKAADAGLKSADAPTGTPNDPVNVVEPKQ